MSSNDIQLSEELSKELPTDLVMNILSYLPAKEICKNRVLSKSILEYSKFWRFGLQQTNRVKDKFGGVIINYNYNETGTYSNSVQHISKDKDQKMPEGFVLPEYTDRVLGCIDGLMIYNFYHQLVDDTTIRNYDTKDHYFKYEVPYIGIVNPMNNKQARNISYPPSPCRYMSFIGATMIFEEEKEFDFKLVCFATTTKWRENDVRFNCCDVDVCNDIGIFIYCSKKDTWTTTKYSQINPDGRFHMNPGTHIVSIDKTLYFVTKPPSFTVCPFIFGVTINDDGVDLSTVQKISLPFDLVMNHGCSLNIAHWRKGEKNPSLSLIVLERHVFRIWIMDNLKNRSWIKCVDMWIGNLGISSLISLHDFHEFTVINDDTLVFYQIKSNSISTYMYNWKDGEKSVFERQLIKTSPLSFLTCFNTHIIAYSNTMRTIH
ncbi:hypothetical protein ZOSMA_336G00050 [Zostera marina]|uniref:F-box domain-containing protein n=1 Tax=Zostera marina TaxID=29655 RepID=A0A0K9P7Z4_ZOSMR|nr:hypothetical protein ZOSMA_336G00050 [Zostera marina]